MYLGSSYVPFPASFWRLQAILWCGALLPLSSSDHVGFSCRRATSQHADVACPQNCPPWLLISDLSALERETRVDEEEDDGQEDAVCRRHRDVTNNSFYEDRRPVLTHETSEV